jgi:hypothetical protein
MKTMNKLELALAVGYAAAVIMGFAAQSTGSDGETGQTKKIATGEARSGDVGPLHLTPAPGRHGRVDGHCGAGLRVEDRQARPPLEDGCTNTGASVASGRTRP